MRNPSLIFLRLINNYSQKILLLLIVIFASYLMFYAFNTDNEQFKNIFSSIASSLLASCIFAFFYTFFVENNFVKLIKASIQSEIEPIEEIIRSEICNVASNLLPTEYFAASDRSNDKFNILIQQKLNSSDKYFFKGVTGRHIAARLRAVNLSTTFDCRVIIVDPRREDLLVLHYNDRWFYRTYCVKLTSKIPS